MNAIRFLMFALVVGGCDDAMTPPDGGADLSARDLPLTIRDMASADMTPAPDFASVTDMAQCGADCAVGAFCRRDFDMGDARCSQPPVRPPLPVPHDAEYGVGSCDPDPFSIGNGRCCWSYLERKTMNGRDFANVWTNCGGDWICVGVYVWDFDMRSIDGDAGIHNCL